MCVSDPVIREARSDDLPNIMFALQSLAAELGEPFKATAETLQQALFGSASHSLAFVANISNNIVGIAFCGPYVSTTLGCTCIFISDLWVASSVRGQSIGRHLLEAAVSKGKERWQANAVVLNVDKENKRAQGFYQHLGFKLSHNDMRAALTGTALSSLVGPEHP